MLRGKSKSLSCIWCKGHLARQYTLQGALERLAGVVGLFPFQCEDCRHRFVALAWRDQYLEWDGQVLIMPDSEYPKNSYWDGAGEFYTFAVIVGLIGIVVAVAIVWLARNRPDYQPVLRDLQKEYALPSSEQEEKK